MKRLSIALLSLATLALPAAAGDLSGRYAVTGTNFDGSSYKGEAEIVITSDSTCAIAWSIAGRESGGICMPNGNAMAAAYEMDGDIGLVIYKIEGDGTLKGVWTIAGQRGQGTDVLTPIN
jgi:hypothetical protein